MASVIRMPKLSPTMEEGVLLKWHKKAGDTIAPGDVIAEVETDKANMDFPLEDDGVLLKLLVAEGETVKLGAPVAVLGEPGENAEAALAALDLGGEAPKQEAAPAKADAAPPQKNTATQQKDAAPQEVDAASQKDDAAPQQEAAGQAPGQAEEEPKEEEAPAEPGAGRVKSSPLARKVAAEAGVDLRGVTGSGPGGRVVRRDVDAAQSKGAAAPQQKDAASQKGDAASQQKDAASQKKIAAPPQVPASNRADTTVPLSQMRKTVAKRLVAAKQTVPHFYLTMDARADALWRMYVELKQAPRSDGDETKISVNDLVLKAAAIGLTRVPKANASFSDEGIVRHGRIDIGVAVSIEDGLITPVVRDADLKTVGRIASETRDLAARARIKKLKPEEYTGSTFSVSNLGMFGVREFAAIVNPPEGAILAVGALEKRAVVIAAESGDDADDTIEIQRVMSLTLSCDHRVVDGALGAELLRAIVQVIEHPSLLVL